MLRKNQNETPSIDTKVESESTRDNNGRLGILITSRLPQVIRSINSIDNPQNYAIFELFNRAQKIIKIFTPNLNAPFVIDEIVKFVNRGGLVQIILGHSFNEKRESTIFIGGTNQYAVNQLYHRIDSDYLNNLDIRWFSFDGVNPIIGNVAGASHLKFLSIDDHLVMVGNANMDIVSTSHAHEINIIIDSYEITSMIEKKIFDKEFDRSIVAMPSINRIETLKHSIGLKGIKSLLGQRFIVKIINIDDEGSGMKTYWLSKPDQFVFCPGQYINVRSGKNISSIIKKPLQIAISSGINEKYIKITSRYSRLIWNSNHCLNKNTDQLIEIEGPLGTSFPINELDGKKLILIAGGSGITPLRSVIYTCEKIQCQLFYSAKTFNDILYKNEINNWTSNCIISLTQEKKEGFKNVRITDILRSFEIDFETYIFICGPMQLIIDVRTILKNKSVSLNKIYVCTTSDALHGGPVLRGDHPLFN
jgi:NAD(P)H-flavin reductase